MLRWWRKSVACRAKPAFPSRFSRTGLLACPTPSFVIINSGHADRRGNRRGDALCRGRGAGLLLLRVLRFEFSEPQPRHVHDDLGGGTVRRARLQTSLPRHLLRGEIPKKCASN